MLWIQAGEGEYLKGYITKVGASGKPGGGERLKICSVSVCVCAHVYVCRPKEDNVGCLP